LANFEAFMIWHHTLPGRNMREHDLRKKEAQDAGHEWYAFNPNCMKRGQAEALLAMFSRNVHSACPMSAATDELQDWRASRFI